MRFADIIAELTARFRADLEPPDPEWRRQTDPETALITRELELGVPPAPRDEKYLTDDDIERWVAETGIPIETLFDSIAIYLARGFHAGTLTFRFCDAIVNDLNVFTLRGDSAYAAHAKGGPKQGPPKLFREIFLAFDAGEYWRPGSDRGPVTSFTRPAVAEIIEANVAFRFPDDSLSSGIRSVPP